MSFHLAGMLLVLFDTPAVRPLTLAPPHLENCAFVQIEVEIPGRRATWARVHTGGQECLNSLVCLSVRCRLLETRPPKADITELPKTTIVGPKDERGPVRRDLNV